MERSKEIVRRYLCEVVSGGNVALADSLMAENLVFTSPRNPLVHRIPAIHNIETTVPN